MLTCDFLCVLGNYIGEENVPQYSNLVELDYNFYSLKNDICDYQLVLLEL